MQKNIFIFKPVSYCKDVVLTNYVIHILSCSLHYNADIWDSNVAWYGGICSYKYARRSDKSDGTY